ncbi:MAG: hypothetical protein J7484_03840 [Microbacterium sp.]|nr:hypothetical protein [Microbacterium sp.]
MIAPANDHDGAAADDATSVRALPTADDKETSRLDQAKLLLSVAALLYGISLVIAAREWWQFFFFAIVMLLGIALFVSGVRGLVERRRRRHPAHEHVASE